MSDENPTVPLPDPRAQWALSTDAAASGTRTEKPRKRRWPWLVAVLAVVLLAVGAWFAGEYIARGIVERTIREQVTTQLALPADQPIDIDLPGQVLPQLIAGRFDQLTLSSQNVPFGQLTGDVVVHASDVPIRGDDPIGSASASVTLDQSQLQALLATVEDFPAATVALAEPDVDISMDLKLFALTVPVGVGLTPSASAGQLVLTPRTLMLNGAEISAEALVDQFGAIARTVVRDWEVCIAQYLPAGLELSAVTVSGDTIVADFAIDGAIIHDEALQQNGTCPAS
ncbi:LmeA family phospholipid-binding protein [Microbacterium sp. bgisy203]|uniref:LmeA family phospholipid-binding protein n=1 Tax=Microbacterium sp. bgisy203 TaxID=3413799 RepID=UPI003D7349A6